MLPAALYGQLAGQLNDPLTVQAAALQAALAANSTTTTNASNNTSNESTPTGSRDTTYTKIFVGGLPYHTTDKTLHDYFRQFGEIEEAVVITDRQTQKSRGYGFVTMKERGDAEKACKDPNPIIDGRKANVNLAYLGAKPRNNVQLAGSLSGFQQFPLQTAQLQALFPSRMGLPQFFYPSAATTQQLVNPLASAQLPASTLAALQAQAAQQNLVSQANAAAALSVHNQQQAGAVNYLDYATLMAAAGQNSAHLHPAVSAASGLEQYGYSPYGVLPNAYATQLTAAQAAQLVAASGGAHGALDAQRLS